MNEITDEIFISIGETTKRVATGTNREYRRTVIDAYRVLLKVPSGKIFPIIPKFTSKDSAMTYARILGDSLIEAGCKVRYGF